MTMAAWTRHGALLVGLSNSAAGLARGKLTIPESVGGAVGDVVGHVQVLRVTPKRAGVTVIPCRAGQTLVPALGELPQQLAVLLAAVLQAPRRPASRRMQRTGHASSTATNTKPSTGWPDAAS